MMSDAQSQKGHEDSESARRAQPDPDKKGQYRLHIY
jgi:hypothetical protein